MVTTAVRVPDDIEEPASQAGQEACASYTKPEGRYHHGNLREAMIAAAGEILSEKGLSGLSLRGAARRAGVSQTAPYRHFKDREALLAAVAGDGFRMLIEEIDSNTLPFTHNAEEAVVAIGGAYIRFATTYPERFRLMFGRDIEHRQNFPDLAVETERVAERIGCILKNPALGIGMWATMHGLAWLLVERVADLGEGGPGVLPSRAEIVLRSLLAHLVEA